jgi:hypothetical protein
MLFLGYFFGSGANAIIVITNKNLQDNVFCHWVILSFEWKYKQLFQVIVYWLNAMIKPG